MYRFLLLLVLVLCGGFGLSQVPSPLDYEIVIVDGGQPARQLEYTINEHGPSWRPGIPEYYVEFKFHLVAKNGAPNPSGWDWWPA